MVTVRLEAADVEKMLDGISDRAANLTPAFQGPVDRRMDQFFRQQFETEGAEGGFPWAPLSPTTLELRQRPGHGRGGILHDTGRLWASLVSSHGPESLLVVGAKDYTRGTSVPYSGVVQSGFLQTHVFGIKMSPREVPPRIFIPDPFPQKVVEECAQLVLDYVADDRLT